MDEDGRLRLDYDQTSGQIGALLDVRFKLLALVPTIAVAAVGLLGSHRPAPEQLAVGLLGMLATIGILLYDLRNTQILEATRRHAQTLERALGLDAERRTDGPDRALSRRRLFGMVTVGHELALGLVYGAALGGWSYLVAWGALGALGFSGAREVGGVIGAFSAIAIMREVQRFGTEAKQASSPSAAEDFSSHAR